jgi:ribosomal protein L33
VIKPGTTAGTGYNYMTRKNRRNDPDRPVLRKYDPLYASTSTSARSADGGGLSCWPTRPDGVGRLILEPWPHL